jgi:uncharacterized protein YecA (UPF0149 family)
LNYLCAAYKKFFGHIGPVMEQMAAELKRQQPAANVMHKLNAERRGKPIPSEKPAVNPGMQQLSPGPSSPPGRNDLCPCGSGRKFKKCCLSRVAKR